MRVAMYDERESLGTSSERGDHTQLSLGVIERDDGQPDVVITAGEFLDLRSDLARVTAERDAALRHKDMYCDDALRYAGLIGAVTAERDALRAEVEAMRAILIKARKWVGAVPAEWPNDEVIEVKRALDALRAGKVGG